MSAWISWQKQDRTCCKQVLVSVVGSAPSALPEGIHKLDIKLIIKAPGRVCLPRTESKAFSARNFLFFRSRSSADVLQIRENWLPRPLLLQGRMQNMEGHGQERTACIVVYVCAAAGGSEEIKAQRGAPFCIQALSSLFLFPARLVSSATPSTPPPSLPPPAPNTLRTLAVVGSFQLWSLSALCL